MATLEDITCKIECSDLLVRLCKLLDEGRNTDAADLFAEDAVIRSGGKMIEGEAVRVFLEARPAAIATRHVMTNVLVTPTGTRSATAEAYILVYRVPKDEPDVLPRLLPSTPQAAGDWKIELVKVDEAWKISSYGASPVLEPAK